MKYIFIFIISLYQIFISPLLRTLLGQKNICRFSPSCSAYAKQQIQKHGVLKGGYSALLRLLSCQPFVKLPLHTV